MAVTGIWKITKRLDHVINYISNAEKTIKNGMDKNVYMDLHNINEFSNIDYQTEENCYVSGINCILDNAYHDMKDTKKYWKKEDGILAYHAFQSFKENEVTPEVAHEIGLKLANELWGDKFEVIVATHINTNHVHNHFVINSVSFKDGKKYHDCRTSYALFRNTSDSLCEEYGLSILTDKKTERKKINYSNYYNSYINSSNYHILAKQDLDRAIGMAYSFKDFENLMIRMGYELIYRYNKLSIRRNPYKQNIRIERAFGEDYSISSIEKRIKLETRTRVPFIEAYNQYRIQRTFEKSKKQKSKGIYGLYKYYCYILKVYPRHHPKKILPASIRVEIKRMNEISEQTKLLVSNKIETYEQLLLYKNTSKDKYNQLLGKRENLWRKIKRTKNEDERQNIRKEIDDISDNLKEYRKVVKLCDGIESRLDIVNENIKEFENENERKVVEKDEYK